MPGTACAATSTAACTEVSFAGGGRSRYCAVISASWPYCHIFRTRSAQVLITPVKPTTSVHIDQQDAGEVVDVEPAHDARAVAAIGAELQLPHRRRIDDDAGDDGDAEQDPHQAKEQLARQAGEHVGVQLEHDVGEAPGDIGRIEIGAGMRIHPDEAVLGRVGRDGLADADEHRVRIVAVPDQEMRHLSRTRSPAHWRAAGRDRRSGVPARHSAGFTSLCRSSSISSWKISGRPGDAQQQHEQRADQARPFMDEAPSAK